MMTSLIQRICRSHDVEFQHQSPCNVVISCHILFYLQLNIILPKIVNQIIQIVNHISIITHMYRETSILRYCWSRNFMSDCTCIYKSVRNHFLCIFMLLDAVHCYVVDGNVDHNVIKICICQMWCHLCGKTLWWIHRRATICHVRVRKNDQI